MAKRPMDSGGRQNPVPPELSLAAKKRLRQIAKATKLDYDVLEANAKRLLMQPEELDRLGKLVGDAGL